MLIWWLFSIYNELTVIYELSLSCRRVKSCLFVGLVARVIWIIFLLVMVIDLLLGCLFR
jgi:hypothetical protein